MCGREYRPSGTRRCLRLSGFGSILSSKWHRCLPSPKAFSGIPNDHRVSPSPKAFSGIPNDHRVSRNQFWGYPQHSPFLLLSHNSFKAPSLFKTVILKAVQSVFKLLLLPAVTLHLNRVLSSFSFTRVTICAVIYAACCFVFVFAAGLLFPCSCI